MGNSLFLGIGNKFVRDWKLVGNDEMLMFLGKVVLAVCFSELFGNGAVIRNLSENIYVREYLKECNSSNMEDLFFEKESEVCLGRVLNYWSNEAMESFICRCEENGLRVCEVGLEVSEDIPCGNMMALLYQRVYAWIEKNTGVSFSAAVEK